MFHSSPISFVLALLLVLKWGWDPSLALPQGRLPTFQLMSECDSAMCIKVTFSDGEEDMIAANEYHEERHPNHDVFKGKLLSTNAKAVVILGEGDKKDLIVFKSSKVPACRKYRVDLEAQGETSCMPGPNWEDILKNTTAETDSLIPPTEEMETRTMEISTKERELNANGYILKVAVYYDDVWKEQFKENAETRIDAIMALVDEQYSENTFATEVDVEVVAVEYAKGENWNRQWYTGKTGAVLCYRPGCVDGDITAASPHDVNLWVFLTGSASRGGAAGMAWQGFLCSSNKAFRTSITKYVWEDEYTAEIVTHEIGHNLGLSHDFDDAIKRKTGKMVPRQVDGIDCKGYMDYNKNNDGWSPCSVQDFTSYANRFGDDYCLAPIKDSNTGNEDDKEDEDSNNQNLKVAIVCESYLMNLDCTNGEVLDIVEANYGRQDMTTCSNAFSWIQKRHLENTNCVSKSSEEKTIRQCQGKPSCQLPSKNSFFGDPCGGTYKYLQVKYKCSK